MLRASREKQNNLSSSRAVVWAYICAHTLVELNIAKRVSLWLLDCKNTTRDTNLFRDELNACFVYYSFMNHIKEWQQGRSDAGKDPKDHRLTLASVEPENPWGKTGLRQNSKIVQEEIFGAFPQYLTRLWSRVKDYTPYQLIVHEASIQSRILMLSKNDLDSLKYPLLRC